MFSYINTLTFDDACGQNGHVFSCYIAVQCFPLFLKPFFHRAHLRHNLFINNDSSVNGIGRCDVTVCIIASSRCNRCTPTMSMISSTNMPSSEYFHHFLKYAPFKPVITIQKFHSFLNFTVFTHSQKYRIKESHFLVRSIDGTYSSDPYSKDNKIINNN